MPRCPVHTTPQGPHLPRPHWPLCSSLTALLFCSHIRTTVLLVLLLSQLFTPPLGKLQTHTTPQRGLPKHSVHSGPSDGIKCGLRTRSIIISLEGVRDANSAALTLTYSFLGRGIRAGKLISKQALQVIPGHFQVREPWLYHNAAQAPGTTGEHSSCHLLMLLFHPTDISSGSRPSVVLVTAIPPALRKMPIPSAHVTDSWCIRQDKVGGPSKAMQGVGPGG